MKGFQQREGIDFNEIFSLVVKHATIRSMIRIMAAENLHLEQLNIKTVILHSDLERIFTCSHRGVYNARDGTVGLQAKKVFIV